MGVVQEDMKVARVTSNSKDGNAILVSNYIPNPVLTSFSKVIEHIIYNHVIDFLDESSIISDIQDGF